MLDDFFIRKFIHFVHQPVEKVSVVAHYDSRTLKLPDSVFQYVFGRNIEVVCRFVEYKHIDGRQQQL